MSNNNTSHRMNTKLDAKKGENKMRNVNTFPQPFSTSLEKSPFKFHSQKSFNFRLETPRLFKAASIDVTGKSDGWRRRNHAGVSTLTRYDEIKLLYVYSFHKVSLHSFNEKKAVPASNI
jgi:hypothetical protein